MLKKISFRIKSLHCHHKLELEINFVYLYKPCQSLQKNDQISSQIINKRIKIFYNT